MSDIDKLEKRLAEGASMTPTEQDKEQRYHLASCEMYETLRGIFPNDRRLTGKSCSCSLKELITADRKRVELEARLDELIWSTGVTYKYDEDKQIIQERIAELLAQQEEVKTLTDTQTQ